MKKKNSISIIIIILLVVIISSLVFLRNKLMTTTNNQQKITSSNGQPQKNTRGSWIEDTTDVYYHFPAVLLSDPLLENGMYKTNISPFESISEEFSMLLGSENTSVPFGTCEFDEKGVLTGEASWTLTPIKTVATSIKIGDRILIRLTYPKNPTGDFINYAQRLKTQIDNLEQGQPMGLFAPNAICK